DDLTAVGLSQHDLFTTNITNLRKAIDGAKPEQISSPTKPSIHRALDVFTRVLDQDNQLFSDRSCEWFNIHARIEELTKGGVAILDFSAEGATGVDLPAKQFVIGYLSAVLFDRFTWYKQRERARYLSFILEEAQNFCPGKRYPIGSSLAKTKLSA